MFKTALGPRGFLRTAGAGFCIGLALTACPDAAVADRAAVIHLPERSKPVPLRIEEDADAPTHRIVIPEAVLATLAGNVPGAAPVASTTPARGIVAAVALSAAAACGLVAFGRGRPGRIAAAVICGLSLAAAGALLVGGPALANIAAPKAERQPTQPQPLARGPKAVTLVQGGMVTLEVTTPVTLNEFGADNDAVFLVVGKQAAEKKQ